MEMVGDLTPTSPMARSTTWRRMAACRNAHPNEFFPDPDPYEFSAQRANKAQMAHLAKRSTEFRLKCNQANDLYCQECPVRLECLANVMVEEYKDHVLPMDPGVPAPTAPMMRSHGFRGGLTPYYREMLADVIGLTA